MSPSTAFIARVLLGTVVAFALAGCPGETEPERKERVPAPAGNSSARKTWLEPTDALGPDVWMASREAGSDLALSSPAVAAWRGLLSDADSRFDETDRMIANRTVQLEGMLREIGVRESAQDILHAFMPLAAKGSRRGYGDLCQHYYNLRAQGTGRGAALASLRDARSAGGAE